MSKLSEQIKSNINCFDLLTELAIPFTQMDADTKRCASFIHEGSNPTSTIVWHDHWYSFSDGIGGDVIDMYAYTQCNGDKSNAFRTLCRRFSLGDSEQYQIYENDRQRLEKTIHTWHTQLRDEDREYLKNRHISDATIEEFHIGYNPSENRLVIPIFRNNHPVYYCARSYDSGQSKYKKTYIGDSSYIENTLYGYDTLSRPNDTLYVVEGVFDYLSMHQEGYCVLSNATGLSHKSASEIADISKKFKRTVLCFDNDNAGNGFTTRLFPLLFKHNIVFDYITIPKTHNGVSTKDISDWYSAGFSLNQLFSDENTHDGVYDHLKNTYITYDSIIDYVESNSPYISRAIKSKIRKFINTEFSDEYSNDDKSRISKAFSRGKTHDEYARETISLFGDGNIRYSPSKGFYTFNGIHWDAVHESVIRQYIQQVNQRIDQSTENSVLKKIQTITYTAELPNSVNCLNLSNGTLYFEELIGKYISFSPLRNRDDFCDYVLDYPYDPNADTTEFVEFLNRITLYDTSIANRYCEYFGSVFLDKSINDKAYLFYGEGSNGKTVLLSILEALLGGSRLCSYVGLNQLSKEFQLANLIGKRVNFCHESAADTKESEELIKQITSNQTVMANIKNRDPINFTPKVKFFIDTNVLPKAKDKSDGWARRFSGCVHKFRATFTTDISKIDDKTVFLADPMITDILKQPENMAAVLQLAIEGYKSVINNGYAFSKATIDEEAEMEFAAGDSPLVDFCNDIVWGSDKRLTTEQLFFQFNDWKTDNEVEFKMSKPLFSRRIGKIIEYFAEPSVWRNGSKTVRGYKLKDGGTTNEKSI